MARLSSIILATIFGLTCPALAQERQWAFDMTDTDAYFVFGVPETDDVGVSFWCTFGTNKIKIFVPESGSDIKPNSFADFSVFVANRAFVVNAKTASSELSDKASMEGELAPSAALFDVLKVSDRFQIIAGNHTTTYPLDGDDIKNLVTVCSAK